MNGLEERKGLFASLMEPMQNQIMRVAGMLARASPKYRHPP